MDVFREYNTKLLQQGNNHTGNNIIKIIIVSVKISLLTENAPKVSD
jgi:hypothetical protein